MGQANRSIDYEPQMHEAPSVTNMRRKEKETRVGQENDRRAAANEARTRHHVAALKELARIAGERAKFEDWAAQKKADLSSQQWHARLDQARRHDSRKDALEERLRAFYGPSLATVEHAAAKLESQLSARGVLPTLRRVFTGRRMHDELAGYKATIADAQMRMQEQRDRLARDQAVEAARLKSAQEQRAARQHEGIEKARDRKENTLADRARDAQRAMIEAEAQKKRDLSRPPQPERSVSEAVAEDSGPQKTLAERAREVQRRAVQERSRASEQTRDTARPRKGPEIDR